MNEDTKLEDQVAAAPVKAAPVFDAADKRQKTITLQWPFSLNGKRFEKVVLRRMTQGEVAGMIAAINDAKDAGTAEMGFPIFYDIEGFLLSSDILMAMDADDAATLDEAARDFLPLRFRSETEGASDIPPSNGATTEPS